MKKACALVLASFAISCISSEDRTEASASPWAIETPSSSSSEESTPNPHPFNFYPEETALHGERQNIREDTWTVATIRVVAAIDDIRSDEGGYHPGTVLELSLPATEATEPRRFHLTDKETWREYHERGHSWWWLDAWDGIDVIYGWARGVNLYVSIPRSNIRRMEGEGDTREILHHPISDDILRDLALIEGRIVNPEVGVDHPFELRTYELESWYEGRRTAKSTCILGVSQIDSNSGREIVQCTFR